MMQLTVIESNDSDQNSQQEVGCVEMRKGLHPRSRELGPRGEASTPIIAWERSIMPVYGNCPLLLEMYGILWAIKETASRQLLANLSNHRNGLFAEQKKAQRAISSHAWNKLHP